MMKFNEFRSYLNHNVIKNALLARLTDKPDLISARKMKRNQRIEKLSGFLCTRRSLNNNMRLTVEIWNNESETGKSIPENVRETFSMLRKMDGHFATDKFPTDETIENWLNQMDNLFQGIKEIVNMESSEREKLVHDFWDAAISLHDLIHYLNPHLPEFWDYMDMDEV